MAADLHRLLRSGLTGVCEDGCRDVPRPEVIEFVSQHFVAYQVNTKEPAVEDRKLLAADRLLWEPGFVILDHGGRELRRTVGFLPPEEFLAELRLVLGKTALLHAWSPESQAWFAAVGAGTSSVAPDALFWAGIAAYRIERDLEILRQRWGELRERFPDSAWWIRADVFDDDPPGPGGLGDSSAQPPQGPVMHTALPGRT